VTHVVISSVEPATADTKPSRCCFMKSRTVGQGARADHFRPRHLDQRGCGLIAAIVSLLSGAVRGFSAHNLKQGSEARHLAPKHSSRGRKFRPLVFQVDLE
jgi:hypothetical protein